MKNIFTNTQFLKKKLLCNNFAYTIKVIYLCVCSCKKSPWKVKHTGFYIKKSTDIKNSNSTYLFLVLHPSFCACHFPSQKKIAKEENLPPKLIRNFQSKLSGGECDRKKSNSKTKEICVQYRSLSLFPAKLYKTTKQTLIAKEKE